MAAFEDTFSDTANTALEDHTPDVGTGWTLITGSTTVFEIQDELGNGGELNAINSANDGYYSDNLANADHLVIGRVADQAHNTNYRVMFACVRLTDNNNFIGWRWYGTGGLGSRVTKNDSGSETDLIQEDGSSLRNAWIKVEADGNDIELYHGGTGATPSWSLVASATETFNNTVQRQGVVKNGGALLGEEFLTDYQADTLGTVAGALHPSSLGLLGVGM